MRFILALIPQKSQIAAYVQAANLAFGPINDGYLLNEESSIPHVTVCAFYCEERMAHEIWKEVMKWKIETCPIRILGLMLKKGEVPPYHYSVSLAVERNESLIKLHRRVVELLQRHNCSTVTPSLDLYQPHITLAGIQWKPSNSIQLSPLIDKLIRMDHGPFNLALACSDEIGQYKETLATTR